MKKTVQSFQSMGYLGWLTSLKIIPNVVASYSTYTNSYSPVRPCLILFPRYSQLLVESRNFSTPSALGALIW